MRMHLTVMAMVLAVIVFGGLVAGGCQTRGTRLDEADGRAVPDIQAPVAGSGSGGAAGGGGGVTEAYITQYNAGRYAAAKAGALDALKRGSDPDRDRAALVAGLASHALGQSAEAERTLTPLLRSGDEAVSGKAGAALGLIADDRKDHVRAAGLLSTAALKLEGDESARAALHAGDAYKDLGNMAQARVQWVAAASAAQSPSLKGAIGERLNTPSGSKVHAAATGSGGGSGGATGGYSVQVGVFGLKKNASRAAAEVAPRAAKLGYGQPRVTERPRGGTAGSGPFVVQVGRFPTKESAAQARVRLGGGEMRVVGP